MPDRKPGINRPLTGVLALTFVLVGGFLFLVKHHNDQLTATLIRTGLLLGALWLALPTKTRPAAWENVSWTTLLAILAVGLVFLTSRMRWWALPLVIGIGLGIYFSRVRFRRRS